MGGTRNNPVAVNGDTSSAQGGNAGSPISTNSTVSPPSPGPVTASPPTVTTTSTDANASSSAGGANTSWQPEKPNKYMRVQVVGVSVRDRLRQFEEMNQRAAEEKHGQ